jgi:hypothetical protein
MYSAAEVLRCVVVFIVLCCDVMDIAFSFSRSFPHSLSLSLSLSLSHSGLFHCTAFIIIIVILLQGSIIDLKKLLLKSL